MIMHNPDSADDAVIARPIDETALARAITSNLWDLPDDARCKKNFRNGHVIERYIRKSHTGSQKNGHPRHRIRPGSSARRDSFFDGPPRHTAASFRERNGNGLPAGTDTDLLWLDEPQTLYLKKKLHVHDSVTFAGNLASFFSSACVRDAMRKVSLASELRASADRVGFPLIAVDCDGKIIAWNRAMEALTNTPADEMIGRKTPACAIAVYGYVRPMLVDSLIRTRSRPDGERGKIRAGSRSILTKEERVWLQGGPRHIQCRARYIHDEKGTVIGAIQSIGIIGDTAPAKSFLEQILARENHAETGVNHGPLGGPVHDMPPSARIPSPGGAAAGFPPLHPAIAVPGSDPSGKAGKQESPERVPGHLTAEGENLARSIQSPAENLSASPVLTGGTAPQGLAGRVIRDAREGIIVFDALLRCVLWNPFMEHLTGMAADGVLGRHAFDMFPDLQDSDVDLLLRRALSGVPVESSDLSFRIAMTGKQAWIRLLLSPLHDARGNIAGIIAVVQDTTARRVMEYALESTIVQLMESEEKYRRVFNAKNDPLLLVDTGTQKILDMNDAATELYGYSRAEFPDIPLSQLFTAPEPFDPLMEPQARGIRMYRQRRKDGTIFPADISYANFELRGRELLLLSIRDTTSLHETTDALRLANTKLNLLIGVTRHDVINNLTVAMGYNDLLRNTVRDQKILSMLEKEESALKTIHQQVEFTREYYNLGVKSPVWQNVCDISTRAYSQFVTTVEYACETRDLEIYADPLLEKVFHNLFDNAIRHGESVHNIRMYSCRDGSDLVLVFGDDGEGIPTENKLRIFRKGFGSHTGLGLFLTREILAITRIGIAETGEPGKGARFELRVPSGRYRYMDGSSLLTVSGLEDTDFAV